MQRGLVSGALQKLKAAAHLGMGEQWYEAHKAGDLAYNELVTHLREDCQEGNPGKAVLDQFVGNFLRAMFQAEDDSAFRKIRQPNGTDIDRASLVRQAKEVGDLVTGWGQYFLAIEPGDPKNFGAFMNAPGANLAYEASVTWASGAGAGMLLVAGIPGTGKTHLAKAAYAFLVTHSREVFYRREVDLIRDLQRAINDHNVEEVMDEIQTCPWLIIDDYGAAASGPWGRAQLDAVIDARWESAGGIRTMLTTNLDAEGMRAQSPRIWSRLSDRTRAKRVDTMGAEDYRETRGS
jgi:chromosomal replication initiation ATPase DnaA